jgi:hypothetical protein
VYYADSYMQFMEFCMFRSCFAASVLVLVGCGGGGSGGGADCDLMAMASVSVYVVSTDGTPVEGAVVTYTVDGGETQTANCMDDVCFAGYEVAGEFSITAAYDWTSADGCCRANDSATTNVTVEEGECHVVSQSVTITLDTEDVCVDQGDTGDCLP